MELSCEHPCRGRAQVEQQPDIYNNTDVTTAIFQHARKMAVMNACAQRANVMPRGVPCHRRLFSVLILTRDQCPSLKPPPKTSHRGDLPNAVREKSGRHYNMWRLHSLMCVIWCHCYILTVCTESSSAGEAKATYDSCEGKRSSSDSGHP